MTQPTLVSILGPEGIVHEMFHYSLKKALPIAYVCIVYIQNISISCVRK